MDTSAIVMMLLAMLIIWGGLAAAVVNLNRSPDLPAEEKARRDR